MNFDSRWALLGSVAGLLTAATALPQDDARAMPAPREGAVDALSAEPAFQSGERVSEVGVGFVERMEDALVREAAVDSNARPGRRSRNGRHGTWEVPGIRKNQFPRSGTHYVFNKWGDTRMGIGFPDEVDLAGAWFARVGSTGAAARGVQVVGYRAQREVGRTGWFRDIDDTPSFFAMDLRRVDRIEILAEEAVPGAGWYGMDDLTFTEAASGRGVVVDFEDTTYEDSLTGSGYAGLRWERGTGAIPSAPPAAAGGGARAPGAPAPPTLGGPPNAFVGGGTLPVLVQELDGVQMFDKGATGFPPDTCGAVGIDHVVAVVNSNISAFDKATGQRVMELSLAAFLGGSFPGDPRVVFDPDTQRFIVTATNFSDRIYLAVSSTSDPTGAWFKTFFQTSQGADAGKAPDYPTLGVDRRWILSSAYMVGGQNKMTLFVIEKAPLVAASQSMGTVHAFRLLDWEGAIQPAVHWGDAGEAYAVSVNGSDRIRVRTIQTPVSAPTMTSSFVTLGSAFNNPPDAPALGSTTDLDTVGNRLMNAVYRNGSIWTAHTIKASGRAACRWYELDPVGLQQVQLGTVRDNVNDELHYIFPSIAVSAANHVALGGSATSPNQYVSAFYTGRLATDPAGEMAFPYEYKAGEDAYERLDGSGRNRWGDYSMTSIDPVDDTIWTFQEYAGVNDRWGTRIAQLDFAEACAPVRFCSPSALGPQIDIDTCSLAAGAIELTYSSGTPGQVGYLLVGAGSSVISDPPGAVGDLCLAGAAIGRYVDDLAVIDSAGRMVTDILGGQVGGGNGTLPDPPGGGSIQPGDTWNFQYWARHANVPSTFSDALSVTFTN